MSRAKRGQADYVDLKRRLRSDMTGPERHLWSKLRTRQFHQLKFRRQHGIGPYIVDFYCPEQSLVIELDGDSHGEAEQIVSDRQRDEYLRSLGLHVIRYQNSDVINNLDGVLDDLYKHLSSASSSPSPTSKDSTSPRPSLRRRGREAES